jgi:hypothetical protein
MNDIENFGLFVPRDSKLLLPQRLRIGGVMRGKLIRAGRVIDEWEDHNIYLNQGLDHLLSTEFTGGSQISNWYMAIFAGNYTPTASDTAASLPGNSTEATAYSSSTRVPYSGVEGAQQVTNNAVPATFTFTGSVTIYGAWLTSASAKNSTSGVAAAAAQFSSPKSVVATDQLLLTYAIGASSA